jgi:hypothetical protein
VTGWRRLLEAIRPPVLEDAGGLPWESMYPGPSPAAIAPPATAPRQVRAVASATAPVRLAEANPYRGALTIVNDSTATLYVKHGPGAAPIAGGYTVALGSGATYVLEPPDIYQGEVSGVWSAANGAASITETR